MLGGGRIWKVVRPEGREAVGVEIRSKDLVSEIVKDVNPGSKLVRLDTIHATQ